MVKSPSILWVVRHGDPTTQAPSNAPDPFASPPGATLAADLFIGWGEVKKSKQEQDVIMYVYKII